MTELLSCVGFDFPETDMAAFFDAFIKMLEFYEEKSSEKITAGGEAYLVLNAEPLELLFAVDAYGDSDADKPELFYNTGRWQPISEAKWLPEQENDYIMVANGLSDGGISLNVCVPRAYAVNLNQGVPYEMQAVCFAMKCAVCSQQEFLSSKTTMAPMSFINTGSYQQDASCKANGKITSIEVCKNAYSGCEYYHFTARCEEVVLDILANRETVSGDAHIGDVISVEGWLAGRFRARES